MPDDPVVDPPVNDEDGVDLEELVGKVLDSRGITKERFDSLDGIGDRIKEAVAGAMPAPSGTSGSGSFDEKGFLEKVGGIIDEKITASKPQPKKPPLRRWLGI